VSFPYTPSVSDVTGVLAALEETLDEGLDHVVATHARAARACRAGVMGLGLELWPRSESYAANCVTAVRLPGDVEPDRLLTHVRQRYGVMLSAGYGELKSKLVRLGHMGPASRSLYPLVALSALGQGMSDLGVSVDIGAGAEAVMAVLAEASPVREESAA
jgi:pyridoxamine--pyruvate transaminase